MNPVHQLIYVSAAKEHFGAPELSSLLLTARKNNARMGVGGVLVHHSGSFMQALEGSRAAVEGVFASIRRDPRHHRIVVLGRDDLRKREFSDWSMGFLELGNEALAALPGFNDFFRGGLERAQVTPSATRARELLLAFRDGRFRQFVDAR